MTETTIAATILMKMIAIPENVFPKRSSSALTADVLTTGGNAMVPMIAATDQTKNVRAVPALPLSFAAIAGVVFRCHSIATEKPIASTVPMNWTAISSLWTISRVRPVNTGVETGGVLVKLIIATAITTAAIGLMRPSVV